MINPKRPSPRISLFGFRAWFGLRHSNFGIPSKLPAPALLAVLLVLSGVGAARGAETNAAPFQPVLPDPALFLAGRYVFQNNCVVCHGRFGDGRGELAPTLKPPPRNFNHGVFKFRSTPAGSLPTNDDLARIVRQGLGGTAMPIFAQLPERDVRAVVEYLKSFSARWKNPSNYQPALAVPEKPAWLEAEAKASQHAARGKTLFATTCAPCHGNDGSGNGPSAATLRDSWDQPISPRDLGKDALRAGSEPEQIFRTLITGLDGTPMASFLETTSPEQRWELIAFLLELRREAVRKK
jgi:mono/diheme cytochrome c family protein